jgi:hypothetical protein
VPELPLSDDLRKESSCESTVAEASPDASAEKRRG